MGGDSVFLNLIRAARFERALMPISYIMIPVAFANKINFDISFLMLSCFLMYAVGGLINARADRDYPSNYLLLTAWIFLIISLIISFYNFIITITILVSFVMSFVYSKYSRFILFGDSVILAITHVAIPTISSALILGNLSQVYFLIFFLMAAIAVIVPMKNLNGVEADKKRGYKTLMTLFQNGKISTHVLMKIYFIVIFSAYFFFDLTKKFLAIIALLFFVQIIMDILMLTRREIEAYGLVRFVIIVLPLAFVFDKATNLIFPLISLAFVNLYFAYYVMKFKDIGINGI